MANTIQLKRGLEADRSSVTPAAGELLYTTDTKQVFVGDGSTAGGNVISGGGAAIEATASGALANGDIVVVNSDGTVSVVAGISQGFGTPTAFNASIAYDISATYDSANNKVVMVFRDSWTGYLQAAVGTISGSSITFGTAVSFETGGGYYPVATYDSANSKVVILYQGSPNYYATVIVGTVSGTSISFGTKVVANSAVIYNPAIGYDSANSKVICAYRSSSQGRAVVGTVSGTSISFGSEATFDFNNSYYISMAFDSAAGKMVLAYQDSGSSSYGKALVGTVSGTSISFGTDVVFASTNTINTSTIYDSTNGKVVIAYSDGGASSHGTAVVGTVSGTSISFGTAVVFESASVPSLSAAYDSANGKVTIAYQDAGNGDDGTIIVGSVSGTSITFGTPVVFASSGAEAFWATYDSTNGKVVAAYRDAGNSYYGTGITFQNEGSNLTATNFIGISDGAYANTATATIQTAGAVDDAQTGLTAGQAYYVQTDGTLSTTPGTPSVLAGTAVSATKIIVKG